MSAVQATKYQVHNEVYVAHDSSIRLLEVETTESEVTETSQLNFYRLKTLPSLFKENELFPTFRLLAKALNGGVHTIDIGYAESETVIEGFSGLDMSGIKFIRVDFTDFSFTAKDVRGSDFTECTMPSEIGSKADFISKGVLYDDETIWIDGTPVTEPDEE